MGGADGGAEGNGGTDDPAADDTPENDGDRFDRLPETDGERVVPDRPTRRAVLDWWTERFGVPETVLEPYSFWERGNGKIWAFRGTAETPVAVEGLGMTVLRTRQEHWKPTLSAVQRFGSHASRNVVDLSRDAAAAFLAGRDQDLDWDGDWGYLVVTHDVAGEPEPLGVGLYVYGELRSQVPKGRRRQL
jgi:NOL1/NOP2/fmu family ribosome biogenesis protein